MAMTMTIYSMLCNVVGEEKDNIVNNNKQARKYENTKSTWTT